MKRKDEIIQEIEKIKQLINLTKSMINIPYSEGGISQEKANRTIELFKQDILKLERELNKFEDNKDINSEVVFNLKNIIATSYIEQVFLISGDIKMNITNEQYEQVQNLVKSLTKPNDIFITTKQEMTWRK